MSSKVVTISQVISSWKVDIQVNDKGNVATEVNPFYWRVVTYRCGKISENMGLVRKKSRYTPHESFQNAEKHAKKIASRFVSKIEDGLDVGCHPIVFVPRLTSFISLRWVVIVGETTGYLPCEIELTAASSNTVLRGQKPEDLKQATEKAIRIARDEFKPLISQFFIDEFGLPRNRFAVSFLHSTG